jgi:3-keto-5-aminohexanoate cleavage enzyme
MARDPLAPIITCALTGGYHSKVDWPSLPEQPDEIVEQGIRAWEAGAAVLHIHARDPDGSNTADIEVYREIHTRLCAETDAVIQLTTGGGLDQTYEQRISTALLSPEMCSLNMGFVLFFAPDGTPMMLANPRPQIEWYAREMMARRVVPEYEIYNITMLEELERLIDGGLAPQPLNIGLVLGTASQGGARGTWQNLADMVRRTPAGANIDVIAIGRAQLPLTTIGLAMGLNVRVGLEDNVRYSRTELARDNAHLVERVVRIARELQLEPATPEQARQRLGTRGRTAGAVPERVVGQETPVTPPPEGVAPAGSAPSR